MSGEDKVVDLMAALQESVAKAKAAREAAKAEPLAPHMEPGTRREVIKKMVDPTHAKLGWEIARAAVDHPLIHVEKHDNDVWTISVTV